MKFLCHNCKAKYQIADEKVAGKTVRMKCRKCGHQIEVRAAVTETSVSTSPPTALGGSDAPHAMEARAKSSLATSLSAAKPRAPMAPQQHGHGSALAGAFQRTVQEAPQTVPFPGQQNNPVELSVTDEWYVAINGVPVGPVRISELRRKAASGAVTEDSLCWQEGLEEWRPVRSIPELAALVREAAQGNRPSLVAPPPSNEGRASTPPRAPQRPPPPARSPEPPIASPSREPARPMSPSRSNVVPLRVAASAAHDQNDGPPVTAPLGGAAAALQPAFAPQPSFLPQHQLQMQQAPVAIPDPFAFRDPFAVPALAPPATSPPTPGGAALAPMSALGGMAAPASASIFPPAPMTPYASPSMAPPPRRGVPLWFWPILLFTGVFGVSAAVFVFRQQQPQQPVVIQMPATAPTAADPKVDHPAPTATSEPTAAAPTGTGSKVAMGGPKGGPAPAPTEKKGGIDVSGLVGGGGTTKGPGLGLDTGGPPGPGAGGAGLDGSSVERTVAMHRNGVKRTCWERGGADQKSSVNVTVSATVAPDGSVSGTSSSGDDPVVAKCIESQVRSWRFAAPGSTTTVNIPFKFVRQ